MDIRKDSIDSGNAFDWGKASYDYAKYRDIYPDLIYKTLLDNKIGVNGQRILDIGTGTGVLPRNMYKFGASWVGADISDNQIAQAKEMSAAADMKIDYCVSSAEDLPFEDNSFDVITAFQCYWYFDHSVTAPLFSRLLKSGGKVLLLLMNWLPYEDDIASKSEELVLKYNPKWSGAAETFHPLRLPDEYLEYFDIKKADEFRLPVHFTRESWNGRIKACRGIGASSLSDEQKSKWEEEHLKMLSGCPQEFDIAHYAAYVILKKK